jgi:hypothetical protein
MANAKDELPEGIPVTLWPKVAQHSPLAGVRTTTTDQNGSFKFTSLSPGEYFAVAWEEAEQGLTQSLDFVTKFASDAVSVKLSEDAHETVTVKMISREKSAAEAAKLQ